MKRLLLTLTLLVPALSFGANQASTASTADAANVVIPGLGVTENQLVWWAKEIIPDKFKGPERCWFIMTKMIPTWKKNLRSFHRYADYTTDQKTFPGGSR